MEQDRLVVVDQSSPLVHMESHSAESSIIPDQDVLNTESSSNFTLPIPSSDQQVLSSSPVNSDSDLNATTDLCGWLYKSGTFRRPKLRWFVYLSAEESLAYFRSPDDQIRLGEIDVGCASFTQGTQPNGWPGMELYWLDVVGPGKTYRLLHEEEATVTFWRQSLDACRRMAQVMRCQAAHELSSQCLITLGLSTQDIQDLNEVISGAPDCRMRSDPVSSSLVVGPGSEAQVASIAGERRVQPWEAQVGVQTRESRSSGINDFSFKNITVEAKNIVRKMSLKRPPRKSFQTDEEAQTNSPVVPVPGETWFIDDQSQSHMDTNHPSLPRRRGGNTHRSPVARFSSCAPSEYDIPEQSEAIDSESKSELQVKEAKSHRIPSPNPQTCETPGSFDEGNIQATNPSHKDGSVLTSCVNSQPGGVENQSGSKLTLSKKQSTSDPALKTSKQGLSSIKDLKKRISSSMTSSSQQSSDVALPCTKCIQYERKCRDLNETIHAMELQIESYRCLVMRYSCLASESSMPEPGQELQQARRNLEIVLIEKEKLEQEIEMLKDIIISKDALLMQSVLDAQDHQGIVMDALLSGQVADKCPEDTSLEIVSLQHEVASLREVCERSVTQERRLMKMIEKISEACSSQTRQYQQIIERLAVPHVGGRVTDLSTPSETDGTTQSRNFLGPLSVTPRLEAETEWDIYGFLLSDFEATNDTVTNWLLTHKDLIIPRQYLRMMDTTADDTEKIFRWHELDSQFSAHVNPFTQDAVKKAIRLGIPTAFRSKYWRLHMTKFRKSNIGAANYSTYLNSVSSLCVSKNLRQIELDLPRTMPENRHFDNKRPDNLLPQLRNILMAFSEVKDYIGYCQGLDRLAATLLLNLDEETSFWGLLRVVSQLPDHFYSSQLADSITDQRVLRVLIQDILPDLHEHLVVVGVDPTLFTFTWFLTLFVDGGFHWKLYLRIWDAFLVEGDKVLFRYTLAILTYLRPLFLLSTNPNWVMGVFRYAGTLCRDYDRLTEIAFNGLGRFTRKKIRNQRDIFRRQVTEELANVERARHMRRATVQSLVIDMDMESDDDILGSRDDLSSGFVVCDKVNSLVPEETNEPSDPNANSSEGKLGNSFEMNSEYFNADKPRIKTALSGEQNVDPSENDRSKVEIYSSLEDIMSQCELSGAAFATETQVTNLPLQNETQVTNSLPPNETQVTNSRLPNDTEDDNASSCGVNDIVDEERRNVSDTSLTADVLMSSSLTSSDLKLDTARSFDGSGDASLSNV